MSMRRVLTFVSLLAVNVLWADWLAKGDAHTEVDDGVNASATPAGSAGASPGPAQTSAPSLPPCAQAGPPVSLPPEFPKNFPLPPGTVITASRHAGPTVVLEGFIPMELKEATRFFVQKLPDAGFRLGRGEAERSEAESRFGGDGVAGFFKVRSIEGCPGALQFTVRVQSIESIRNPSPP
jgi:hypothetical protein